MKLQNRITVLSLLFISFFFCSRLFADEFTLIERTFESSNYKNLEIKAHWGAVIIKTWDKQAVNVVLRGNSEALKTVDFTVDGKDGNVNISTSKKGDAGKNPVELRIEVTVPKYFNIDAKTTGNDIKLNNLTGSLKLETAGADISVYDYSGESVLKNLGGGIKVITFKGNLTASTSGGNINLEGSDGEVKAETTGGDIRVKYTGANNGMTLKTTGGDIKIILPETFRAMIDATATAGEIKTDFSVLVNKDFAGQTANGIINGGGNIIKANTTGGKISLVK